MKLNEYPIITIVTVVLNDVKNIARTIESVINQTYNKIEYIIIDGGSKDGTRQEIDKYRTKIDCFISEPDNGLYDAMNKGIKFANGEWIIFMNSGDKFYDLNVLSKIFTFRNSEVNDKSVIYSDTILEKNNKQSIIKARNLSHIWIGPPSSHQSQFVKTAIAKIAPFNIDYKINADYDLIYSLYKNKYKFIYLPNIYISICNGDEGLSKTTAPKKILIENFLVSKKYSDLHQIMMLFFLNIFKYFYARIKKYFF